MYIYIYNIYHYLYIFHVIISFVPSTEVRTQHRLEFQSVVFLYIYRQIAIAPKYSRR